jgi:hypothetical protein
VTISGEIPRIGSKRFKKIGNLKEDFHIKYKIDENKRSGSVSKFCSTGSYKIEPRAKGDVGIGNVKFVNFGISISFSKKNAVFIDAPECYFSSIAGMPELVRAIIEKYDNGKGDWKEEFFLVTKIRKAKHATVIITSENQSSVDAEASAIVPVPITNFALSDPKLGFNQISSSDTAYCLFGKKDLSLMMETWKIHDPFWGPPHVEYKLLKAPSKPERRKISFEKTLE